MGYEGWSGEVVDRDIAVDLVAHVVGVAPCCSSRNRHAGDDDGVSGGI